MATTPVSNTPATDVLASLARSAEATTTQGEAQGKFLTLLTTQLKNQDPLNPLDNAEVTSQLAQISTVDGIERLNLTMSKLLEGLSGNETLQAAALVGRSVLVPGERLELGEDGARGGVLLKDAAEAVSISVRDANGLEVAQLELGATRMAWKLLSSNWARCRPAPTASRGMAIRSTAPRRRRADTASA